MVALNIPASLPDYRLPLSLSTVRFEVWKVFLPAFSKSSGASHTYNSVWLSSAVIGRNGKPGVKVIFYMACGYFETVFGFFVVNSHLSFSRFLSCPIGIRHEYVGVSLYGTVLYVRSGHFLKTLSVSIEIFKPAFHR